MQEFIFVTGMVLKQTVFGEYDKRIVILTKERGKISAFARGARKPGNRLAAATNPFSFGVFTLYPGKDSYTISEVEIQNYFESLRSDFLGAYYGMYFAEIADYYTRENNDERQMLKLLYQTLRAVESPSFDNRLVRAVYEIKSIVVNGEFPGIPTDRSLQDSTVYAVSYIQSSPVEKLYTFTLKEDVLLELIDVAADYMKKIVRHEFKSLEILKTLS